MKYSIARLKEEILKEKASKILFFFRQHAENGCLSQWHEGNPFQDESGVVYYTAEHFMMAEKARLFGDKASLEKILSTHSPSSIKKLGREIRGFDSGIWNEKKYEIVLKGNLLKFSDQNIGLKNFLLRTGNRILAEASPYDTIWGIGLSEDSPEAMNPENWKGENLLGFILMEVRDKLMEELVNSL